jgi:hypothetical protein
MTEASTADEQNSIGKKAVSEANIAQLTRWLRSLPKNHELTPIAVLSVVDLIASGFGPGGVLDLREEEMRDLTVAEFGILMGRSSVTATTWCASGQVPGAYKLQGRAWRIPRASVQRFKEQQSRPKTSSGSFISAAHLLRRQQLDRREAAARNSTERKSTSDIRSDFQISSEPDKST